MVVGNHCRSDDNQAPENYRTKIRVPFPQGNLDHCLFLCLASALHYLGLRLEASKLASMAAKGEALPVNDGIKTLISYMKDCAPSICVPTIFNDSHKKRKRCMSIQDLDTFNPYPTVVIPMGADGSISHAICVIDDLIFDTTQAYALKCTRKSFGWICHCGPQGFVDVYQVIRFDRGFKCRTHI